MKYAVYVSNLETLSHIEGYLRPVDYDSLSDKYGFDFWAFCSDTMAYHNRESVRALLMLPQEVSFSHLYFGQEFCQHLAPSLEDLKTACYTSRQLGWDFTYVTGALTNSNMTEVRKRLVFLNRESESSDRPIEVVVNDWGLLYCLKGDFPNLMPVLGRLLTRQTRYEQSSPGNENLTEIVRNQLHAAADTFLSYRPYRQQLEDLGVKHIDVDPVVQGTRIESTWGFSYGFYYPWSFLTGAGTCLTAALQDLNRQHFVTELPCSGPCREVNVAWDKADRIALQRGNSFFLLNRDIVEPYMNGQFAFNRLIYQPVIPI